MDIPDKNETIYQVIYTSITEERKIKVLKEFGFFNYFITPGKGEDLIMGFSAPDFDKIMEYGGKDFLSKEYKDFQYKQKYNINNMTFDLGIRVNLEKFKKAFEKKSKKMTDEEKEKFDEERKPIREELDKFAKETAEKLSCFRIKIYSYVLEKMLQDVKDGKKDIKPLVFHLNEKNLVHVIPLKDNVELVYGVDFIQQTDQSLAKVFLQELKEAKNHVKNCVPVNVYVETDEVPKNIIEIDHPKKYSNGLVVFNLFVNKFDTIKKFLNYFVTFREYIQFHIHSIKTFLHIRMNRKGKELMGKLDGCRIIPESYVKHLESVQFYTNWNKKEENQKIFTDEVKKINV